MRHPVAQKIKLMVMKESMKRGLTFQKVFYRRAKKMYTSRIPWNKRENFTLRDLP